ncbi:unnamed protein product [Somion occarium]|uniref:Oxidoreductase AflY n=1 Tax=Somion occarium TaxID=3059160 RepID=A0ABP1D491_9APHY
MDTSPETLTSLFPVPSPSPKNFGLVPTRIPGLTYDSAQALLECLKDNHRKRHIFFNDRHFHNHASHHLLAIYALGADRKLLQTAYQTHVIYQRPSFPSPGEITVENWKDHLGNDKYYQAYVTFFTDLLLEKGGATVFEDYILSKNANLAVGPNSQEPPYLLSRYLGGFLHPLIHTGYGAEFGQLGMWAEGLAEACVQSPDPPALVPESLFGALAPKAGGLVSQLTSLALSSSPTSQGKTSSPHALAILAHVAADPAFKPSAIGLPPPDDANENSLQRVARVVGDKLLGFLNEWTVESDQQDLEKKLEEVFWMNALIYSVGGWSGREQGGDEKKEFNAQLKPSSAVLLLRTYFVTSLALYIARGRPALPIAEFYQATNAVPVPPGVHPTPCGVTYKEQPASDHDLTSQDKAWADATKIITPNPWLPIIQTTLVHPNEHLCKLQRSLAHFASEFGQTAPGTFSFLVGPSGLDGADVLDGTLFIRAAGLTANRLGWMREGQNERGWDMTGFFQ